MPSSPSHPASSAAAPAGGQSGAHAASAPPVNAPPETAEGWYVLHEVWSLDWVVWRHLDARDRELIAGEAALWLADAAKAEGGTACYGVLGQKGDLLIIHYRRDLDALHAAQLAFRRSHFHDYVKPAYGYTSVIEASLYEVTAIAQGRLAALGITPSDPRFESEYQREFAKHRQVMDGRLRRSIPEHRCVCFYPMSKRRSDANDANNWYALSVDERRALMRGHGRIGHKYHDSVVQVIGGSIGLDDWEWSVDLHADDPLVFKKLVTEMRFDPASSRFAEFGPFYLGLRQTPDSLQALLTGG